MTRVRTASSGSAGRCSVADGPDLPADVVVFATGVRPRDELARAAGLAVGERGGVVVDSSCRTSDPEVWAIGEVACIEGRVWGLVAPGYTMAEIVADRLLGGAATFPGADSSTKLKLLGVDVASFGDAFGTHRRRARGRVRRPGRRRLQEARPLGRRPHAARRHPRRRRVGLRLAAPDGRTPARRRPGVVPAARGLAAGARETCPTTPSSAPATTSPPARSVARSPTRAAAI